MLWNYFLRFEGITKATNLDFSRSFTTRFSFVESLLFQEVVFDSRIRCCFRTDTFGKTKSNPWVKCWGTPSRLRNKILKQAILLKTFPKWLISRTKVSLGWVARPDLRRFPKPLQRLQPTRWVSRWTTCAITHLWKANGIGTWWSLEDDLHTSSRAFDRWLSAVRASKSPRIYVTLNGMS